MRVAKNYQKYAIIGEPYEAHGHWYTKINLNGQLTEVRLYNDEEYEKMYPAKFVAPKEALGFEAGYITLITGKTATVKDWLNNSGAKYHKIFGWYLPSTSPLPKIIPEGINLITLPWDKVSTNNYLKSDLELEEIINELFYGVSSSHFVGEIGERITLLLTVKKVVEFESKYGKTRFHIMEDTAGNRFTWTTNTRSLVENQQYKITATIKTHETYHGEKRNVITRCVVQEEPNAS